MTEPEKSKPTPKNDLEGDFDLSDYLDHYEELQHSLSEDLKFTTTLAPLAAVNSVQILIIIVSTVSAAVVLISIGIVIKLTRQAQRNQAAEHLPLDETQMTILSSGGYQAGERNDQLVACPPSSTVAVQTELTAAPNMLMLGNMLMCENVSSQPGLSIWTAQTG